jgi:hypothetical protein
MSTGWLISIMLHAFVAQDAADMTLRRNLNAREDGQESLEGRGREFTKRCFSGRRKHFQRKPFTSGFLWNARWIAILQT